MRGVRVPLGLEVAIRGVDFRLVGLHHGFQRVLDFIVALHRLLGFDELRDQARSAVVAVKAAFLVAVDRHAVLDGGGHLHCLVVIEEGRAGGLVVHHMRPEGIAPLNIVILPFRAGADPHADRLVRPDHDREKQQVDVPAEHMVLQLRHVEIGGLLGILPASGQLRFERVLHTLGMWLAHQRVGVRSKPGLVFGVEIELGEMLIAGARAFRPLPARIVLLIQPPDRPVKVKLLAEDAELHREAVAQIILRDQPHLATPELVPIPGQNVPGIR